MSKPRQKLSDFAREQGMAYISIYKLWQQDLIEGIQLPSGTILVSGWKQQEPTVRLRVLIYARVPTMKQSKALAQQVTELERLAEKKNYEIVEIVEEIGFGFSGNRPKMLEILERTDWDILLVEHKEIPIKFGFEYLNASLVASGRSMEFKNHLELSSEAVLANLFSNMNALLKTLIGIGNKRAIEAGIDRIAS